MTVTDRDAAILRALTAKIRLLTLEQIASHFWPEGRSGKINARKRLAELETRRLLRKTAVVSHPLLPLTRPLATWWPGKPTPDATSISTRLCSRWGDDLQDFTAFFAGPKAITLFGSKSLGGVKNRFQVTHDLQVSTVYLHLLRTDPRLAEAWMGEEILAESRRDQKLPDAILCDEHGSPRLVIEVGGKYSTERVTAFMDDCQTRRLPFEIW